MVAIHFWALLYLLLRESLKGPNHGSICTTPFARVSSEECRTSRSRDTGAIVGYRLVCGLAGYGVVGRQIDRIHV